MFISVIQNCAQKFISLENITAIATAFVAFATFIVTVVTLWKTLISPANISAKIGKTIAIYFSNINRDGESKKLLCFSLNISIVNSGARTGLIEDIAIKVKIGEKEKIFKVFRKLSEIQIKPDKEAMQKILEDPFAAIVLNGKTSQEKNYMFIPFDEETIKLNDEEKKDQKNIKFKLYLRTKNKWIKADESNYSNTLDISSEDGWALIEACENLKLFKELNNKT